MVMSPALLPLSQVPLEAQACEAQGRDLLLRLSRADAWCDTCHVELLLSVELSCQLQVPLT